MLYAFTPQNRHEGMLAVVALAGRGWGVFRDDTGRSVLVTHATVRGGVRAPRAVVERADIVLCCYPQAVADRLGVHVVARGVNVPLQIGFSRRTGNVLVRVPKA